MATVMPALVIKMIKEKFDPTHVAIVEDTGLPPNWDQVVRAHKSGRSSPISIWYGNSHISVTTERKLDPHWCRNPLAVLVSIQREEIVAWTTAWKTWHYTFHFDPITVGDERDAVTITLEP